MSMWDPAPLAAEARGVGMSEAPRGALAHWIVIKDRRSTTTSCGASTWNASPRDGQGRCPLRAALIGTPVANAEQPLEIIRTIHFLRPVHCVRVHLHDERGRHVHQVRVF